MQIIHFDQLHSIAGALVDLGSAWEMFRESQEFVLGDGTFGELRQKVHKHPPANRREYLENLMHQARRIALQHQAAIGMLEQAVVHDVLLIDRVLVDPQFSIAGSPLSTYTEIQEIYSRLFSLEFFALIDVPESVRASAANEIYEHRHMFIKLDYKPDEPFYGPDKTIHDALHSADEAYSRYCFATSEECAERAWFYLCVSHEAHKPLIVSNAKMGYLHDLGKRLRSTMHAALSERLLQDDLKPTEDAIASEIAPYDAPLSPIQDMILIKALRENLSPLDACLQIRNTPEAKAYRAVLTRLYNALLGPANTRRKAKNYVRELSLLAAKWRIDPDEEIIYRSYKLRIGKLPGIGSLAEAIDPPLEWDLPKWLGTILNSPDPSHVFISSWFRGVDSEI
jgi:hypothetical protein